MRRFIILRLLNFLGGGGERGNINSLRLSYIVVGMQTGSSNSLLETGKEILCKTEFTSLRLCMIAFD